MRMEKRQRFQRGLVAFENADSRKSEGLKHNRGYPKNMINLHEGGDQKVCHRVSCPSNNSDFQSRRAIDADGGGVRIISGRDKTSKAEDTHPKQRQSKDEVFKDENFKDAELDIFLM